MANRNLEFYTWYARVLPVFLVLLPLALAVAVWLPGITLVARLGGTLLAPFGIAMLFSQIGRDSGYRKQPDLWKSWGGAPTTQILRHRGSFNPVIRQRYHKKLKELQPDVGIPTPEEETEDPQRADSVYESCIRFLISRTRDRAEFPLVFKENVNYGFRRNFWGMKPLGLSVTIVGLVACAVRIWVPSPATADLIIELSIAGVINLCFLLFWAIWVTPKWVRIPAEAYAERLLEACDRL